MADRKIGAEHYEQLKNGSHCCPDGCKSMRVGKEYLVRIDQSTTPIRVRVQQDCPITLIPIKTEK